MLRPADDTIIRQLRHVMEEHHPQLIEANVHVLVKVSDKPVKVHGTSAYAKIKVTSPERRSELPVDAVMTIDGKKWESLEPETQAALLDHELQHLVVQWEYLPPVKGDPPEMERRQPKLDDYDRPKLKTRGHDFEVGWFKDVAARHGEWSIERRQAADLAVSDLGQVFWLAALPTALAATGTGGRAGSERRAPTLAPRPMPNDNDAAPSSRERRGRPKLSAVTTERDGMVEMNVKIPGGVTMTQVVDAVHEVARQRGATVVDDTGLSTKARRGSPRGKRGGA